MFEGVGPNLILEGCFSTLKTSLSLSTHSFHNCQCNNSRCFQRAKMPFIILYVMIPFSRSYTWSNRSTEKTPQMFGLIRSWTYFQRGQAIGFKKGPSCGVPTLSLPKISLFYLCCPLLIGIHGCGICNWHGACSWSTHWCECTLHTNG